MLKRGFIKPETYREDFLLTHFLGGGSPLFCLILILYWDIVDLQCRVSFQVWTKVIQLYTYMYLFFFRFFSHVGYCRVLSRVPYAIQ